MRLLVTGGCGFSGSHFVRFVLEHYQPEFVTNVDVLTYAGNKKNVAGVAEEFAGRYEFYETDIANREAMANILSSHKFYAIINFAAETHVDRSIRSPQNFIHSNITGTAVLLELAREFGIRRFIQISTDEVYGPSNISSPCNETAPLHTSSPYSASKAAADLLALSAWKTYNQETSIIRGSNLYGERQHVEKLIPKTITHAIHNQPIPVYGNGTQSRQWLHVSDFCRAVASVLFDGQPGEIYNAGGETTLTNLELVHRILKLCGRSDALIQHVTDRAGHDSSYAMDCNKSKRTLKWAPIQDFDEGLQQTVQWYHDNKAFWLESRKDV